MQTLSNLLVKITCKALLEVKIYSEMVTKLCVKKQHAKEISNIKNLTHTFKNKLKDEHFFV